MISAGVWTYFVLTHTDGAVNKYVCQQDNNTQTVFLIRNDACLTHFGLTLLISGFYPKDLDHFYSKNPFSASCLLRIILIIWMKQPFDTHPPYLKSLLLVTSWHYVNLVQSLLVVNTESLYCKRGRENTGVSLYRKRTALLIYSFKPLRWIQSRLIQRTGTQKPSRKEKQTKTEKQTHIIFGFFSIALSFTKCILSFWAVKMKLVVALIIKRQ